MSGTKTKGSIVNDAYKRLTISGVTTNPSPEEVELALVMLEEMCAELDSRNICTNFAYEETPDPNSESGISPAFSHAATVNLAVRISNDFGREPPATMVRQAAQSLSNWASRTANVREIAYPTRQPMGSGNNFRYAARRRFYPKDNRPDNSCEVVFIGAGDVSDYSLTLRPYLNEFELVASYEYSTSSGLTILSESLTDDAWGYRVECSDGATKYQSVKFKFETDAGRKLSVITEFEVTEGSNVY